MQQIRKVSTVTQISLGYPFSLINMKALIRKYILPDKNSHYRMEGDHFSAI